MATEASSGKSRVSKTEVSDSPPETSVIPAMARTAAGLIRGWRTEVSEQWHAAELELDEPSLAAVFNGWSSAGLDPTQLLWIVLGAEWLLRVRKVTDKDFDDFLERVRVGLLRGTDDPYLANLVIQCGKPALWRRLRGYRVLVSYRALTVPWTWDLQESHFGSPRPRDERQKQASPLVPVRRGPVVNLGPVVASVLSKGVADHLTQRAEPGTFVELASALLKRRVLAHELDGWRSILKASVVGPDQDDHQHLVGAPVEAWLIGRFLRMYSAMRTAYDWQRLCEEAASNPGFVFAPVGDPLIARLLYSLKWSRLRRAAVIAGAVA